MKNNFLINSVLVCFLLSACDNVSTEKETAVEKPSVEEVEQAVLQPVPQDFGEKLTTTCTAVEITFYQVGASISSESCGSFFGLIDNTVPQDLIKEEFGHMLFLASGELLSLAKIHLKDNKGYLKFEVDNAYYYQNFNEQGIKFFNNIKNQQAPQ